MNHLFPQLRSTPDIKVGFNPVIRDMHLEEEEESERDEIEELKREQELTRQRLIDERKSRKGQTEAPSEPKG